MLKTDGIPPRLAEQVCEELICQQYWYQGKVQQEVDALFIKVNGHWHQLYFDSGVVFWRIMDDAPRAVEQQPDDLFVYPLINVGEKFDVRGSLIADCVTEALIDGVRISFIFADNGSLMIKHSGNMTSLRFVKAD